MGETMRSILDADRARASSTSATTVSTSREAADVLVTASGAPGTAALLHALRENGEREVRLVGTDMSERAVGRHLCDAFHLVPAAPTPASRTRCSVAERRGSTRAAAVLLRPPGPGRARERFAGCPARP